MDLKTGPGIRKLQRCAMEVRYGLDQGQPQTGTGRAAASVQAIEAFEDVFPFFLGDTWAVVVDRGHDGIAFPINMQRDLRSFRAVANGVFQEVREHLGQQSTISPDVHALGNTGYDGLASVLGYRSIRFGEGGDDLRKINWGESLPSRPGFNLGDAEKSGKDGQNVVRVVNGCIQDVLVFVCGHGAEFAPFQTLAQAGKRHAQVVGDVA